LRNLFGGTYASLFFIDCIFHSDLFASIGAGLGHRADDPAPVNRWLENINKKLKYSRLWPVPDMRQQVRASEVTEDSDR